MFIGIELENMYLRHKTNTKYKNTTKMTINRPPHHIIVVAAEAKLLQR